MYRKFREKEVATAARGLIGLFREINPALLAKKDRGRGADLGKLAVNTVVHRQHATYMSDAPR